MGIGGRGERIGKVEDEGECAGSAMSTCMKVEQGDLLTLL
jgi:hypothetical protein